jgi:hypothetical protein
MTPKEKAQKLVDKMTGFTFYDAKSNALIAVDEIIDVADGLDYEFGDELKFWKDVKQEIEKL